MLWELHDSPNDAAILWNFTGIPLVKSTVLITLANNQTDSAVLPVAAQQELDLGQMDQVTKMSDQARYFGMTTKEYKKEDSVA